MLIDTLREAEAALAEGLENCGGDPECIWASPLAAVRAEIAAHDARLGRIASESA
jgi:hypothetical protein